LPVESCENQRDSFVELAKNLRFRRPARLGELKVAVANIARTGNASANVITEIAGKVEQQVADGVAMRERLAPELVV